MENAGKKDPLFSVIVPVYNVKNCLERCLDSVLEQTERDFECIVIDDGSTDGSGEICDAYANRDPRIRVIHQENRGLSGARNAGLDAAQGVYVYFADSDDYLLPLLLEKVREQFEKVPGCDHVIFQNQVVELNGEVLPREHETGIFTFNSPDERFEYILYHLLEARVNWEVWDSVFLRERIEQFGLRFFDNRIIFAEDQFFLPCYIAHTRKLVSIPDELYVYERREGSLSEIENRKQLIIGKMSRCAHEIYRYLAKFDDCRVMTDRFPLIYVAVIRNEVGRAQEMLREIPYQEIQKEFTEHEDAKFFMEQTRYLIRYLGQMHLIQGRRYTTLKTLNMIDLLRGKPYWIYSLTDWLLERICILMQQLREMRRNR